ncbi:MAG TPA: dual specificity protein phosphatase family protein [Abditibacteriaceae bacterium]|jgi:protein-tyrosine phosphatase
MKYAVVFILFGFTCAFYAATSQVLAVRIMAASFAVAFSGVGLAYAFIGHRAFLKKLNGQLSFLSYVLYWPYHLLNWLSLRGFRRRGRENAFDKIDENVYLGCRLSNNDKGDIEKLGIKSVLDLTCEFSEIPALRQLSYRCIPIPDTRAPSLELLKSGAEWIHEESLAGPVYVHCALGHGRSAMFVAAYLLFSGKALTAQEALDKIKIIRPRIGLHPEQVALLEKMSAHR